MNRLETRLEGPLLLEPTVHGDSRGFFLETFRASALAELGVHEEWVQDNHSRSARGVLRGMHFQPGMAKLVRCARGAVLDVLVDMRPGSASFGHWEGYELDDERHLHLYVPDGFAHGFCVLSETADVIYKCSAYYDPVAEGGFRFDDPQVGIRWPEGIDFQTSERDRSAPLLSELSL
jgi:dTDP-4-dehydrorhamnose 3,5-epimerase